MSRKSKVAPLNRSYEGHLFIRCVPVTTKAAFKAACAETGNSMRDVMLLLMRKYAQAVRSQKPFLDLRDIYAIGSADTVVSEAEMKNLGLNVDGMTDDADVEWEDEE